MELRLKSSRDLGETMVIAHAVVKAEQGESILVLIDDGEGRAVAIREARRLERRRAAGKTVGAIELVGTLTVLEAAAGTEYIPDRGAMKKIYSRLRELDDGLLPIQRTRLLAPDCWTSSN